jgi:hypothetical protein
MAFCESKLLGYPEYLNSFSSLFISGFGILGLQNNTNNNFILESIYTIMVFIGLGSFGYHWSGTLFWRLMDETPMIIGITLVTYYFNYLYNLIKRESLINNRIEYFIFLFLSILFIIFNSVPNYSKLFPTLFGLIGFYLYCKLILLIIIIRYDFKQHILEKIIHSIGIILFSAFIWILTENYCLNSYLFLLGHPLWHFFIGLGFYNLIQTIYFIDVSIKYPNLLNLEYNKYKILKINYK